MSIFKFSNSLEFSLPNFELKYSYNPLTASLPNISLEIEFGKTSITPHPGAVAVTLYGKTYKSNPELFQILLKIEINCRAKTSCLQSSPTLKMALCHFSIVSCSPATVSCLRTLKVAINGALAWDCSGLPEVLLISTTTPSGFEGK
ncbi:hypothetical protein WICMUC_002123 [Wickerhamomyces mucosus]|uniref:Uncharacterized protein n=1 Tax=Wickerhamomyces mucosus TaxID=1378264 RepID=A0A9P8TET9_9ASCO|nr:hypothetical protein WICMUC_002123 [Wickerhamomyces mucosus]